MEWRRKQNKEGEGKGKVINERMKKGIRKGEGVGKVIKEIMEIMERR